jgi:hypothetical protein
MNDGKGYPIPEPLDPGALRCFRVYVPDDTLYIGAFWRAYEFFTSWLAWERDEDHRGAAAAAVWKAAFNQARIEYEAGEGCEDMSYDTRVKPGYPYIQQASSDGGATWHDSLILPHWEAGAVAPPINSDSDGEALSAAMMRNLWKYIAQAIRDALDASLTRAQAVNQITGQFAPYGAGSAFSSAIGSAYDSMSAMDEGERDDWTSDCQYVDMYNELGDFANANPYSWLDQMAAWLFDHLNDWSDTLMYWLNSAAAALGGGSAWNWTANQGGAGGGSGFGGDCDWEHTFDFTTGQHGWVPSYSTAPSVQAQYHAGAGFGNNPAYHTDRIIIELDIDGTVELTGLTINTDTPMTGDNHHGWVQKDGFAGVTDFDMPGTSVDLTWSPTSLGFLVVAIDDNSGDDATTMPSKIVSITLRGTGLDPF